MIAPSYYQIGSLPRANLTIIGCGNTNRQDDGVGPYVIEKLLELGTEAINSKVSLLDLGTAGIEVMFAARGAGSIIIVDASCCGNAPGTITELCGETFKDLVETSQKVQSTQVAATNLHSFAWNQALIAGEKIFKEEFPKQITVILIEAESVDFGIGLSATVEKSANEVVSSIRSKLMSLACS